MGIGQRVSEGLARGLTQRPWAWMGGVGGLTALALWGVSGLGFDSSYLGLLPDNAQEVRDVHLFEARVGSGSELAVVVKGGPGEAARVAWANALAERLRQVEGVVLANAEFPVEFFLDRALWLLPLAELEAFERLFNEGIAAGLRGDFGGFAALQAWSRAREAEVGGDLRRVYTSADGETLLVPLKVRAMSADMTHAQALIDRIQAQIQASDPDKGGFRTEVVGRLMVSIEESAQLSRDVGLTTVVSLVLCVLLVARATRRIRSPLLLALPLVVGVVWTLGLARWVVGELNLVSGLMVPVLVGLGIDFSAHLVLHYLRALDEDDAPPQAAMQAAIRATIVPCATGALTTAAAFFTLLLSSYEGISGYGLLVGIGVVVMFITNYALVPGLALALMKHRKARPVFVASGRGIVPRGVAWAIVGALGAAGIAGGALLWGLRYHNDFKEMRGDSAAERRYDEVASIMGGPLDPSLVMVESLDAARALTRAAQARIDAGDPWVGKVLSVASLVPDPLEVEARRAIIEGLRFRVGLVPGVLVPASLREDFGRLQRLVAAEPWALEAVPEAFRVRLQIDGGEGSLVLIWPRVYIDNDDATTHWLAAVDRVIEDAALGQRPPILDINRVIHRMNALMLQDLPRLSVAVALVMLALLGLHLRRGWEVFGVWGALGLGLLLLVFVMRVGGFHLNLLNVVVLPTVVGMGIDNAVHILHTYRGLGRGSLGVVLHLVGRPAALASATTAVGFGSLVLASHPGIRGVGVLSIVGISAMFLSTTVLVLAVLQLVDRPSRSRTDAQSRGGE